MSQDFWRETGGAVIEQTAVTQMYTAVSTALSAGYQLCVLPNY